ncbi:MAG: hypothetical protein JRJ19_06110, partial [Deltaproteobacteria bacterium]|nr:hypothetical protein [Deltaproteobacteria bacterium]
MGNTTTYLRCALVWERTILEERLFPPASKVSIGESPSATFTLPAADLGKRHVVLHHTSRGTILALRPGMHGQIKLSGVTREADELLNDNSFADRKGDEVRFTLNEGDEGILVFGRAGLQFNPVSQIDKTPPASISQILGADPYTSKIFGIVCAVLLLFSLVSQLFAGSRSGFEVEHL